MAATNAALPRPATVEEFLDWKRQARETVWLLASDEANDLGTAIGIGGWHEPPGVARMELGVVPAARGRGVGSALLADLGSWAAALGYRELLSEVQETDTASVAWTAEARLHRGGAATHGWCSTWPESRRRTWRHPRGSRS